MRVSCLIDGIQIGNASKSELNFIAHCEEIHCYIGFSKGYRVLHLQLKWPLSNATILSCHFPPTLIVHLFLS